MCVYAYVHGCTQNHIDVYIYMCTHVCVMPMYACICITYRVYVHICISFLKNLIFKWYA